jgi:hypothetical protein
MREEHPEDTIAEEQRFVDIAWRAVEREIEALKRSDAGGGADKHAMREVRRILDARLMRFESLDDS